MATKLPKEYVALLDQYTDEDLAKLADVPVAVVAAARAARDVKPDAAPVLKAPEAPSVPSGTVITIDVPEGVDVDKLQADISGLIKKAARAAAGAPRAVKYIGNERKIRHPETDAPHVLNYGDICKGKLAQMLWDRLPELVKVLA